MRWWLLGLPVSLCALPSGENVLSGDVEFIASSQALEVRVQGAAVIQWDFFDIADGESVTFVQLDGTSSIENQVVGGMSVCAGSCSSNAPMTLMNPEGIDFQGHLQAQKKIVFSALSGECRIGGSLEVPGGSIRLRGQSVHLSSGARIDVSSGGGGGVITVMQGIPRIEIEEGAQLLANGIDQGYGGAIYLYADDQLFFYGQASARGGDLSGQGGKIALTGWNAIHFPEEGPQVDVGAPNGRPGIVKIYPAEGI